jgi:hypothetical protein
MISSHGALAQSDGHDASGLIDELVPWFSSQAGFINDAFEQVRCEAVAHLALCCQTVRSFAS